MVFSQVLLILGVAVDRQDIEKFVAIDEDGYPENDKIRKTGFKVYQYPCCSELRGQMYIIGRKIKVYTRFHSRCERCSEYGLCDKCIGMTSNGYYDVENILKTCTSVPSENICSYCFSDNSENKYPEEKNLQSLSEEELQKFHEKQKLNERYSLEDFLRDKESFVERKKDQLLKEIKIHEFERCKECNRRPNWNVRFDWEQPSPLEKDEIYQSLEKLMERKGLKMTPRVYYMLDGCLSCT